MEIGQILIVKKQLPNWVLPRQVVPSDKIVDLCNTSSLEHCMPMKTSVLFPLQIVVEKSSWRVNSVPSAGNLLLQKITQGTCSDYFLSFFHLSLSKRRANERNQVGKHQRSPHPQARGRSNSFPHSTVSMCHDLSPRRTPFGWQHFTLRGLSVIHLSAFMWKLAPGSPNTARVVI